MGQVLQAGAGQITARQAAVKAGIPMTVPALTINKVCLSGLDAIALADQLIRAGEFEIVVAGGMESMTKAPHLLPKSREGYKYGDVTSSTRWPTTACSTRSDQAMGESTERYNAELGITREEQDAFSARSHQRAAAAQKNGLFDEEIVPVEIPQRKGDPIVFNDDEGVRADTTAESLAKLRPAFAKDGTITAGSSSQISDGACGRRGDEQGQGRGARARPGSPRSARTASSPARTRPCSASRRPPSSKACARRASARRPRPGRDQRGVRRVGIQSMRELGLDRGQVNVNGGAIALGHPIGMSGARLALHLALELQRRGGGVGAAALCGGGGQGDALLLRVPDPAAV